MSEPDERGPENVRMIVNGHEIPCNVRRMPEEDHEHDGAWCRAWLVIPQPGQEFVVEDGFELGWKASYMPSHSTLLFDISIPVPRGMMN